MDIPAAQTDDPFLQGVFASPLVKQLQAGDVPAIYITPQAFGDKAAELFPKLETGLPQIGLGVVMAPNRGALVAYNTEINTPDEILAADAQGGLDNIAVPLQTGNGGAPAGSPAPAVPAPSPAPAPMAAGLMTGGAPPNNSALQQARAQAVVAAPPIKQMNPSRGLINGLTSRAT